MTDPVAGNPLDISARVPAGCPVIHLDASPPLEVGSHWQKANELRETSPTFFNTHAQGYWVFTRYDEVREMYQHPGDLLERGRSSRGIPEPAYRFVPTQIDPPEHAKYRQLISRWFAPNAVKRIAPQAHEIGRRLVADLAPTGECDFVADFAMRLPDRDLPDHPRRAQLGRRPVRAVGRGLLRRLRRRPRQQERWSPRSAASGDYWVDVLEARRGETEPREDDFVSHLVHSDRRRRAARRRPDPRHPHRAGPGRARHHPGPAGLPVPPPRRPPRRPAPADRRAGADPVRGRGVAAALHDHLRRRSQGRPGHRLPRLSAQARATWSTGWSPAPTATRGSTSARTSSSSTARPTTTSASPAGRTAASARTWPGWSCRSPSRSG